MRGHTRSGQRQHFVGPDSNSGVQESPDGVEVPQPSVVIRQQRGEAVLVPQRAWQRLKHRVRTMPKASALWLLLAGACLGVVVERHDESALPFAGLAALFFLAHEAVSRANQRSREDIASEMELYEPNSRARRRN